MGDDFDMNSFLEGSALEVDQLGLMLELDEENADNELLNVGVDDKVAEDNTIEGPGGGDGGQEPLDLGLVSAANGNTDMGADNSAADKPQDSLAEKSSSMINRSPQSGTGNGAVHVPTNPPIHATGSVPVNMSTVGPGRAPMKLQMNLPMSTAAGVFRATSAVDARGALAIPSNGATASADTGAAAQSVVTPVLNVQVNGTALTPSGAKAAASPAMRPRFEPVSLSGLKRKRSANKVELSTKKLATEPVHATEEVRKLEEIPASVLSEFTSEDPAEKLSSSMASKNVVQPARHLSSHVINLELSPEAIQRELKRPVEFPAPEDMRAVLLSYHEGIRSNETKSRYNDGISIDLFPRGYRAASM
eukprot:CAMPEP_0198729402 /NCGR_PEP_ID=MMETSP1475-20131203/17835_1 /TAXON_ID= ORGANISM="Unidentified sp., Strain CCMP1999" /NCGR_SAMPLE_ID=MMETSP1475 /ASSEMBLY_ACC=CAM_ASM_001111 /LENGTH=361 /DNA_ID=CAMNT_0044492037 /DNA_START=63 /DNA_END=1148 /DNA_ORIENTATION=+